MTKRLSSYIDVAIHPVDLAYTYAGGRTKALRIPFAGARNKVSWLIGTYAFRSTMKLLEALLYNGRSDRYTIKLLYEQPTHSITLQIILLRTRTTQSVDDLHLIPEG